MPHTTRGQQWPAGADDVKTQPLYTCTCGAQSSSPINHNHSR